MHAWRSFYDTSPSSASMRESPCRSSEARFGSGRGFSPGPRRGGPWRPNPRQIEANASRRPPDPGRGCASNIKLVIINNGNARWLTTICRAIFAAIQERSRMSQGLCDSEGLGWSSARRITFWAYFIVCCMPAAAGAAAIYDSIPNPLPGNVPSLGYQSAQTAEFGDLIQFAGADLTLSQVTIVMSDWALAADYPS